LSEERNKMDEKANHIDRGIGEAARRTPPIDENSLDDAALVYSSEFDPETGDAPVLPETPDDEACRSHFEDGVDTSVFTEVIFKRERRGYYVNETGLELAPEMYVLVEAEKGVDLGIVGMTGEQAWLKSRIRNKPCQSPTRKIVRIAEENDVNILRFHREQEETAFEVCQEKIHKLGLPMKLVDVEFQYDRNRITFYFTADGRVDFRELVRELASEYRTRIELRQIGPRDEAKRLGGYGVCGREICCSSWLDTFEPISTEMAKLQNLSLNPFKLAGQCGRLKCCLSYELQVYEQLLKRFPPLEYRLKTPKGMARIEKIDIFQDAIFIHYEKSDAWEKLSLDEINRLIEV